MRGLDLSDGILGFLLKIFKSSVMENLMRIDIDYVKDIKERYDVKLGVADKYLLLKHINSLEDDSIIRESAIKFLESIGITSKKLLESKLKRYL